MDEKKKYQVYFVASPIGNLAEITFRAVEILKSADIIFCEDTRRAAVLLMHYGISKRLVSYHRFNEKSRFINIFKAIEEGKTLAVISDAGMPAISDPGAMLIKELIERNISHTVISGATALINAFVLSGFDAPFIFFGFLPDKAKLRKELLERATNCAMIFYSSPHNLNSDLDYLYEVFGDRRVAVIKEISKLHETVLFGRLGKTTISDQRGEYVLVIDKADNVSSDDPFDLFNKFAAQGMSKMDAIKKTAAVLNQPKQTVYALINNLGDKKNEQ